MGIESLLSGCVFSDQTQRTASQAHGAIQGIGKKITTNKNTKQLHGIIIIPCSNFKSSFCLKF